MSVPPLPPPLENLGRRPFSFYPPVIHIEHNEWIFQRATWSEILVLNTKTNAELWVPRRFLGEVSRVDEPVMIVGLKRELEYKAGSLWPHERRVIEIPRAVNDFPRAVMAPEPPKPAAVVGIRLDDGAESRAGKLILSALAVGVIVCLLAVTILRGRREAGNVTFVPVEQQSFGLTSQDDYFGVVRKLGQPKEDRWRSATGELQYRVLDYPDRGVFIILMGKDRDSARYIGTMDSQWRAVDVVKIPHAGDTRAMLNRLARF